MSHPRFKPGVGHGRVKIQLDGPRSACAWQLTHLELSREASAAGPSCGPPPPPPPPPSKAYRKPSAPQSDPRDLHAVPACSSTGVVATHCRHLLDTGAAPIAHDAFRACVAVAQVGGCCIPGRIRAQQVHHGCQADPACPAGRPVCGSGGTQAGARPALVGGEPHPHPPAFPRPSRHWWERRWWHACAQPRRSSLMGAAGASCCAVCFVMVVVVPTLKSQPSLFHLRERRGLGPKPRQLAYAGT